MEHICEKDRQILRELAKKQLEYANCPKNGEILRKWDALAHGRRETPTVRLLFSNFVHEVVTDRLQCQGNAAREMEAVLVSTLVGRELFDDDTPISPTFDIQWDTRVSPFGINPHITHAAGMNSQGYHIDPVIEDLERDLEKLRGGNFGVDREKTGHRVAMAQELFGDILPVRMLHNCLCERITSILVRLMGMENYYLSMYDYPDELHQAMEMATRVYEEYYDFMEREQLLSPTCGIVPIRQESFAFNSELPTENVTKTTDCWGFAYSQETTAVSPEFYGEFVYPYQDRLVKRFGLLSYGCCERVDTIWPDYLSKWKNLRRLSVSCFNNEEQMGEILRDTNIIFYSKPRSELATVRGPLDEDMLRKYFKRLCQAASGCLFEIGQREVGTLYGDFNKGRRYVAIAKECIEKYWKP